MGMKRFRITITTSKGRSEMTGLFRCSIDAMLAGMDTLDESDPSGRVSAQPE